MADTPNPVSPSTNTRADEAMRPAVERFRTRMFSANTKFIQDRIAEIEARGCATETEKRSRLCFYRYMDYLKWDDDDPAISTSDPEKIRLPSGTSLSDIDVPAILKALPYYPELYADGVLPPLLRTDAWRQMYVDTLQRAFQRQADEWVPGGTSGLWERTPLEPLTIPPCDELALFLTYAGGVSDPDFRYAEIAPFNPSLGAGIPEHELRRLSEDEIRERYADPEFLDHERERLTERLEDHSWNSDLINESQLGEILVDDDLEIRAGFVTGQRWNSRHEGPEWFSAYLYCRLWPDDSDDEEEEEDRSHTAIQTENPDKNEEIQDAANIRDWGWRVVFFRGKVGNPTPLYGRRARFDSIPEFLDWYASWAEHLDARGLRSLVNHAVGCKTDCETDCEEHYG
ncbi:hypothetical protein BDW74DRAFT_173735 [Aspergillus multicolor]|uniref:uncharacterized protein n=1 Tax=Aspergillus multicolor TaxID=41759 RepID=UPI003CCDAF5E